MVKWLAAITAIAVALPVALLFFAAAAPAAGPPTGVFAGGPAALARADVPPVYLVLYLDAAQTCAGLPWGVLAGIGKTESDHGRSPAPGIHSGGHPAGAEDPVQFEPGTFAGYAVDGDHDGRLDLYDPADAIYTAAAMLCANGAAAGTAGGLSQAVFAYNHFGWDVRGARARRNPCRCRADDRRGLRRDARPSRSGERRSRLHPARLMQPFATFLTGCWRA